MTLIHEKRGTEAHPLGFVCNFKVGDGEKDLCGLKFDSQWYLTRHKDETGHKIARRKNPGLIDED